MLHPRNALIFLNVCTAAAVTGSYRVQSRVQRKCRKALTTNTPKSATPVVTHGTNETFRHFLTTYFGGRHESLHRNMDRHICETLLVKIVPTFMIEYFVQ